VAARELDGHAGAPSWASISPVVQSVDVLDRKAQSFPAMKIANLSDDELKARAQMT